MNKQAEKQQRIENILLTLKRFDYMTREQLQVIHNLKGERNANRILKDMEAYLSSFYHGKEKVYYLNKAGRDRVQAEKSRAKTQNVQHFLLRNQLWIRLGRPFSWENEYKIVVDDISIQCDAIFYKPDKTLSIVEVDISQAMIKNRAKIERYKRIKELSGNEFELFWITELESRKPKLLSLMGDMPGRVFSYGEIK
jgi:hypothetical protein